MNHHVHSSSSPKFILLAVATLLSSIVLYAGCDLFQQLTGETKIEVRVDGTLVSEGSEFDVGTVPSNEPKQLEVQINNVGDKSVALNPGPEVRNTDSYEITRLLNNSELNTEDNTSFTITYNPQSTDGDSCDVAIYYEAKTFEFRLTGKADSSSVATLTLSPPSWIIGTWVESITYSSWAFTADNVVLNSSSSSTDFKSTNDSLIANGVTDSGYFETVSDSTDYELVLKSQGTVVQTNHFHNNGDGTMTWTLDSNQGIPYTKN